MACQSKHLESIKTLLGASERSGKEKVSLCVTITPDEKLFVFEARGRAWTFHQRDERARLSAGRDVYFCMLDDNTMMSETALWSDGVEIWGVVHISEEAIYHLDERGVLPPSFQRLKQARMDEQDKEGGEESGVDFIISIAMDLAKEFTGYDGGINEPEGQYFEWSCPKAVGFFGRLFGKRNS